MDPNILIALMNGYLGSMNYSFNFDYEYQHGQALTAKVNDINAKLDKVVDLLEDMSQRLDQLEGRI